MKLFLLLIFFFNLSCSYIITTKEDEVEIISVRGHEREVQTIQNTLKREGCFFMDRIDAFPNEVDGIDMSDEKKLKKVFRRKAFLMGAHKVISTLSMLKENEHRSYGLAYKCPHLDKIDEE